MSRSLHRLSAVFFYLLGGSFFVAYLLFRNSLFPPWPETWLKIADLPFALAALLFGGSSLYVSVHRKETVSWPLLIFVSLPLLALFAFLVMLNFWDVLGLPQGPGV